MISHATLWLTLALVLAGLEMVSGTFYLLAIAIGLVFGAMAAWLQFPLPAQIALSAIISMIAALSLRNWKATHIPPSQAADNSFDIGQRIEVIHWKSERLARVHYRGCEWDAELNPQAETGLREYFIHAVQSNTLIVHHLPPEKNS